MPVVHFGEYIMELEKNMKLVILIDADNASADIIEPLLEEIAKYGVASVKRIYGDWSNGNLKKMARSVVATCDYSDSAVFVYQRKKCDRYGNGD